MSSRQKLVDDRVVGSSYCDFEAAAGSVTLARRADQVEALLKVHPWKVHFWKGQPWKEKQELRERIEFQAIEIAHLKDIGERS